MMSQDDILTIPDVADFLKVAEKTVYGLAQKGDLPGFKVGGQWRFRRTAIDSWIDGKTPRCRRTNGQRWCETAERRPGELIHSSRRTFTSVNPEIEKLR